MKRLLLLSLFFALPALGQSSINFTWTNSNPSVPTCSSTVTTSCMSSLTLTDTTSSSSPVILNSAIPPTATTYTTTLPSPGSHSYSLVVNGKDAVGNSITSSAATTTVTVPQPFTLNAPTGFTVKVQ